jgi:hypothetical protein
VRAAGNWVALFFNQFTAAQAQKQAEVLQTNPGCTTADVGGSAPLLSKLFT